MRRIHFLPLAVRWLLCLIVVLTLQGAAYPQDESKSPSGSPHLHTLNLQTPQNLRELLRFTGDRLSMVSAHRGGALPGFPENCLATFENTLQHTFAILEIDPRRTRDGEIVVIHDATLERTTTGKGRVADQTLRELKTLRLKDTDGKVTEFRIPSLDEVLRWARGKTVLVLDQKDVTLEERVTKIEEYRAESYAMVIVYSYEDARRCYEMNNNIMMEVMIPNRKKFAEFDKTGVPWNNVVAFVGHTPPRDAELNQMIHAMGACCIAGTSRNLDRQLVAQSGSGVSTIERAYRTLLGTGIDLIETDLPIELGRLLYSDKSIPASKSQFFRVRSISR